ncbi:MAG: methionyl-tRNA formyltransferase [Aquificota bacterium]|nr:methionyl-tRNA formyltransferase [Aquificota bacterium]
MKVLFLGTPEFSVPSLELVHREVGVSWVVTQPDRPSGRGMKVKPPPVKLKALDLGIPVFQPETRGELQRIVEDLRPDIGVVVAYGMILPGPVLRVPRFGFLNLHPSLLPKFRGPAPIQRTLMAGERETGNTVILLTERTDAGPILSQEREPVLPEDNLKTLSDRLARKGARLLVRTLRDWTKGGVRPIPQKEEEATYAPPLREEEHRICWLASAESVRDRVRGLFPNAYTHFRGRRIKVLKVTPVEGYGEPGEITDPKKFIVACGEGAVRVDELISPKGRRISGEDFCRGYSPRRGELLK